jgi:integrase
MSFGKPKKRVSRPTAVERGIYRIPGSDQYYERPKVGGRWTWRTLGSSVLSDARDELRRRRASHAAAMLGQGVSVYAKSTLATVGEIINTYLADGCLDRQRRPRIPDSLKAEKANCTTLLGFFDKLAYEHITLARLDEYCDWRREQVPATKGAGYRTVDLELNTLNNAMIWALRRELIRYNPLAGRRVKYARGADVRHCREFMPENADALHAIARSFFVVKEREKTRRYVGKVSGTQFRRRISGWQVLIEAYTGLRTHEALKLRLDAKPGEPGHISKDWKVLDVGRGKGQAAVNPFVIINDGLKATLQAMIEWRKTHHKDSPWYFPSCRHRKSMKPAHKHTLGSNLLDYSKATGKKVTSHGMRAFYVTVRRSWGVPDAQIAAEIGHTSGGLTLVAVYGGVPANWLTGDGPKMEWLPKGPPAWAALT